MVVLCRLVVWVERVVADKWLRYCLESIQVLSERDWTTSLVTTEMNGRISQLHEPDIKQDSYCSQGAIDRTTNQLKSVKEYIGKLL